MAKNKNIKPLSIAGVEVNLLQSYEENRQQIEKKIEEMYSYEGAYKKLMKKSKGTNASPTWIDKLMVSIAAFFLYLSAAIKGPKPKKLKQQAVQQLDEYYYNTETKIQMNLIRTQAQIDKLEEEIVDIQGHIYELEDTASTENISNEHLREIESMQNRFEVEKQLCEAKLELTHKSKEQLHKILKAYEIECSIQKSRIKLQSLELQTDASLSNALEVNEQIQVLKQYVLMIEETQQNAWEEEEDYRKIISLEKSLERISID